MEFASDKNVNICFDCANAYAHKCEYIREKGGKRITECEHFVSDYVAKGLKPIMELLGCSRYLYSKIGNKGLKRMAKEQGYRLYIYQNESGKKHYGLRPINKDNNV